MLILTWIMIGVVSLLLLVNVTSLIKGNSTGERIAALAAMAINFLIVYVFFNYLNCLS